MGQNFRIHSKVLGQDRQIQVFSLPVTTNHPSETAYKAMMEGRFPQSSLIKKGLGDTFRVKVDLEQAATYNKSAIEIARKNQEPSLSDYQNCLSELGNFFGGAEIAGKGRIFQRKRPSWVVCQDMKKSGKVLVQAIKTGLWTKDRVWIEKSSLKQE